MINVAQTSPVCNCPTFKRLIGLTGWVDGSVPTEILQVADASSTSNASLRLLPPVLRGTLSGLALTALTVAASGIILLV
jgi:hypothetical protein